MKFDHYLKVLGDHKNFKKFIDKNPKAYLAAGFFVLDYETGKNMYQIDYSLPDKKVATFLLDQNSKVKVSEQAIKKKLPKIKGKAKTDLDALKGIVEDEMKNRIVTEKIRKVIAILHTMDDKLIWNLQVILDGLNILLVHIDDSDQTILKFEKHSLMELIKPAVGVDVMPTGEAEKGKGKSMTTKDLAKIQEMLKAAVKKKGKKKQSPLPEPEPGPEIPEPAPQKRSKKK